MPKLKTYSNKTIIDRVNNLVDPFFQLLKTRDIYLFGGFVRDAVAGLPYHDIDVVTLPETLRYVESNTHRLGINKFEYYEHIGGKYIDTFTNLKKKVFTLYQGMTTDKGGKVFDVDFICSQIGMTEHPKNVVVWAGQQVDIRCCGLLYDAPTQRVIELIPGAYDDATSRKIKVLPDAGMYNEEKTKGRVNKLLGRGWSSV
jgi:hypothetical protein